MTTKPDNTQERLEALGLYLTDHYAGATAGRDLARNLLDNNRESKWEPMLERLVEEIEAERDLLGQVLDAVGTSPSMIKNAGAWIGERARRLKPHTDPTRYTDLDRLVEFEALFLGVSGKLSMWRNLAELERPELEGFNLVELYERAERQREDLKQARLDAAKLAFG